MESSDAVTSTLVNWESLDALVADIAASENLIEPASPLPYSSSPSPSSSSYGSRMINRQIRWSLENGEMDRAIELLRVHAPCLLEDHRILFRLEKQYLISTDDISESHLSDARLSDGLYEFILEMKELTSRGMAMEVFEEINNMDPDFFKQNPLLLFQLKQVEFLNLVSCGDDTNALQVAKDSELLWPLKETLLALLRPEEGSLRKCFLLDNLATSLQVAVGRRLRIEEPRLMKIMRATLHTHSEWLCRDRFQGLLRIDFLKDISQAGVAALSKSNADSCSHGSSVITTSSSARMTHDGSSPAQVSSSDGVCDESAILKVMISGLP